MEHLGKILRRTTPQTSKSSGQPESSTSELPACGECDGKGWIQPVVYLKLTADEEEAFQARYGKLPEAQQHYLRLLATRRPDGRIVPCVCEEQRHRKTRGEFCRKESGLGDRKESFANFLAELNPGCQLGFRAAQKWAEGKLTPWLMLTGKPGIGKTHLLVAATRYLVGQGVHVRYVSAPELYFEVLEAVKEDRYPELVRGYKQRAVLALDDLGAERATEFAGDLFHSILDARYHEARPTLIASNLGPEAFPPRLRSRLGDLLVVTKVEMAGEDVRRTIRSEAS